MCAFVLLCAVSYIPSATATEVWDDYVARTDAFQEDDRVRDSDHDETPQLPLPSVHFRFPESDQTMEATTESAPSVPHRPSTAVLRIHKRSANQQQNHSSTPFTIKRP